MARLRPYSAAMNAREMLRVLLAPGGQALAGSQVAVKRAVVESIRVCQLRPAMPPDVVTSIAAAALGLGASSSAPIIVPHPLPTSHAPANHAAPDHRRYRSTTASLTSDR